MTDQFYITGGTLPPDAGSYVARRADTQLLDGLRQGEFCYVLNTRQMGKSSLMTRTALQLRQEGCRIVVLDLTAIGQNLTIEQWYAGLLARMGQQLNQTDDLFDFWRAHRELGPMQRFLETLRYVLLTPSTDPEAADTAPLMADTVSLVLESATSVAVSPSPTASELVIFVDEIDAVRSLPFSADEFFAGIRECYNRRSHDPAFARLTFCLLGVATPSDLIQDTRISPFNIGRRIELNDFSPEEAEPLATGLNHSHALRLLKRILHWTNGHPYLTQRLCYAVAEALAQQKAGQSNRLEDMALVDSLCERLFLSRAAQETDDNLTFVRSRILRSEADVTTLLDMYLQISMGRRVRDDETNPLCSMLRLSGITVTERGMMRPRNRIYSQVFDRSWVMANLPGAEIRRQKRAYRLGLLRAGGVFGSFTVLIAILLGVAVVDARRATSAEAKVIRARTKAERLLYFSDMQLMQSEWENSNLDHILNLLEETRSNPQRGWEWDYWNRRAHPRPYQTISGKTIFALFSPDNRLALEDSHASALRVYNLRTGTMTQEAGVSWTDGMPLDYAPDGSHLWIGNETVCDAITGDIFLHANPSTKFATIRALRDGKSLLTGSSDGTLSLWDLPTHQCRWHRQTRENALIKYIVVSDTLALTTDAKGRQHLYRLQDGTEIPTFDAALKLFAPTAKAFSHDGAMLAGECIRGGVILLDLHTGRIMPALGADHMLKAIQFGPQDKTLVTAFWGAVKVWDWRTGQECNTFLIKRGFLESYAISPDGRYIATGNSESETIWDLNMPQDPQILTASNKALWQVRYSPDGRQVAAGGNDGNVYRWEAGTGLPLPTLRGNGVRVNMAAYAHNGNWIATACADGIVRFWDVHTGQQQATFRAHQKPINALCFSRDDRQLLTAGDDNLIKIWDIAENRTAQESSWTCTERLTLHGHKQGVEAVAFSPDETQILTGSDDQTVKLWDARTGGLLYTFPALSGTWSVAFSPEGTQIAFTLGGVTNTAEVWDLATHKKVHVLEGHTNWVTDVAFSPNGKRIVTGSRDETARVWDAESGHELLTLKGHDKQVCGVAFSPDGNQIATSGQDGTLRLWNAAPLLNTSTP